MHFHTVSSAGTREFTLMPTGDQLNRLAAQLDRDASGAADAVRVKTMTAAVRELARASR
ncbi:MAG: hypothetical protein M3497_09150 [Gemmatimonadota bacterium]|nr:hypothetical protein [Gemmatimonadota bacterium]